MITKLLKVLPLLFGGILFAQEEVVQSVYFEFDKYNLDEVQAKTVVDFIKKPIQPELKLFKYMVTLMILEKMHTIINFHPIEPIPFSISYLKTELPIKLSLPLKEKAESLLMMML